MCASKVCTSWVAAESGPSGSTDGRRPQSLEPLSDRVVDFCLISASRLGLQHPDDICLAVEHVGDGTDAGDHHLVEGKHATAGERRAQ